MHMKMHELICFPKYNQVVHIWLYCYLNLCLWLIIWDWATKMYSSFWKNAFFLPFPNSSWKLRTFGLFLSYSFWHLHWYHSCSNGKFKFTSSRKFIVFDLFCFENFIHTYNMLLSILNMKNLKEEKSQIFE